MLLSHIQSKKVILDEAYNNYRYLDEDHLILIQDDSEKIKIITSETFSLVTYYDDNFYPSYNENYTKNILKIPSSAGLKAKLYDRIFKKSLAMNIQFFFE